MSEFDFTIKADAAPANAAVGTVVKGLTDIEIRALLTGRAIDGSFKPLRDAQGKFDAMALAARQAAQSIEATASAQDRLNSGGGGSGGGHGGGLGTLSHIGAALGIGISAHELVELADSYIEISNKIRVSTDSGMDFNHVMAETKSIALDTRTSWDQTASTFQRLSAVTHDLGLTQRDVLKLTREMAQGSKISGASAQEAAMAMGEINHAFEVGSLQGREFKVLMRDTPALMHELQVASGKTASEFAEMGKHGKITADLLISWFDRADASISEKFGRTIPTMTERWEMFKTSVVESVGKLENTLGVFQRVGAGLQGIAHAASEVSDAVNFIKGKLDQLEGAGGKEKGTASRAIGALLEGSGQGLERTLSWLDEHATVGDKIADSIRKIVPAGNDVTNAIRVSNEEIERMAQLAVDAKKLGVTLTDIKEIDADAAKQFEETRIKLKQRGVEVDDQFTAAKTATKLLTAEIEKLGEQNALKQQAEQAGYLERSLDRVNLVLRAQVKSYDDLNEKSRNLQGAVKFGELVTQHGAPIDSFAAYGLKDKAEAEAAVRDFNANRKKLAETTDELILKEKGYGDAVVNARKHTIDQTTTQQELDRAFKAGDLTMEQYAAASKKAHGALSEVEKMMQRLMKPEHDFELGTRVLGELFETNRISADLYRGEIRKLQDAYFNAAEGGKEFLKIMRDLVLEGQRTTSNPEGGVQMGSFSDVTENPHPMNESETAAEITQRLKQEAEELKVITDAAEEAKSAELKLLLALDEVDAAWKREARGGPRNAAYDAWEAKQTTLIAGLDRGLKSVGKQATDVASVVESTLGDAFKGLEDNLVEAFTGGETSWREFASTIEKDLVRIALRILEMKLLMAAFGGVAGGGGAAGGGGGLIGGILGAVTHGGSHDDGGTFYVGGSGGRDSQMVMMNLTPGERLDITPRGGGPGGGGGTTIVRNIFDPRMLLDVVPTDRGRRTVHNLMRQYKQ